MRQIHHDVVVHDVLGLDAEAVVRLAGLVVALRRLHGVADRLREDLLAEDGIERPGSARVPAGVRIAVELGRLGRELGVEHLGVVLW